MKNHDTQIDASSVPRPAGAGTPQETDPPVDRYDLRLSRVLDYQADSLAKANPLEATLGSLNSGLLHMGLWLEQLVLEMMASGPRNMETLREMLPAIDTHLKITRQVGGFAQMGLTVPDTQVIKPDLENPAISEIVSGEISSS